MALIRIFLLTFCTFLMGMTSVRNAEASVNKLDLINATLQTHNELVRGFAEGNADQYQVAVAALVNEGIEALIAQGETEAADFWRMQFANEMSLMNVGDHLPLSQKLADFYVELSRRLPPVVLQRLNLEDINTLNFTIPVVFQPRGDRRNGEHWDMTEYRRHFVPFSAIATYWASYAACTYYTQEKAPQYKSFCGQISKMLRQLMEMRLGPVLSDIVYKKATQGLITVFEYDYAASDAALRARMERVRY